MVRRGLPIIAYALLIGGFVTSLWSFPSKDRELPLRGTRPSVEFRELGQVSVEGLHGLPEWSAKTARPIRPGSVVSIGGVFDAFELEGVSVEFGVPSDEGKLRLTAAEGRLVDGRLSLGGGVRVGSRVVSGTATIVAGQIEFPGLVVFHHGTPAEVTERSVSLTYSEFVARVHRR